VTDGALVTDGLFVTATDTGVGKTVLSASLLAAMAAAGESVRAHKPVVTGTDESPSPWPADHELLAQVASMDPREVTPVCFGPPVSPHLAAELAGVPLDFDDLVATARAALANAREHGQVLVIEGVGGLLTPLTHDHTICDLAAALGLPLLVAARPSLGTISHTLLTLSVARAAGLTVRAAVITPWPAQPSAMERSNLATIARMGSVEVACLPAVSSPQTPELARAGDALPWREWLARTPQ
jgi:dethiobiotin synthetase